MCAAKTSVISPLLAESRERWGQGGLEVCPGREAVTVYASGDEWTPLEPCEGAICINIGDMLMQWSDDKVRPVSV
jgi:isopenicillin N synthase-like dioxygenase